MKKVGIIDNLVGIEAFRASGFHKATASEVMRATGGNTGNVAFVYAVRMLISNPIRRLQWEHLKDARHDDLDHVVVCCANQLGPHADLGGWADALHRFNKPVTLIGLGAQSESFDVKPAIPEGTLRFLGVVKDLRADPTVCNIGVRGAFTQAVLKDAGVDSVITGCPSLLISPERELGKAILERQSNQERLAVAVAAGNPWHGASSFLENALVDIVDKYRGVYVLQHPQSMLEFGFGEVNQITESARERFLRVYDNRFSFDELLDWYRHNSAVFVDVPNWIRFLRRFDLAVGSRYHGVALAVQGLVPGCVFAIDSRTQELCDESGIKSIPVALLKGMEADTLIENARWNKDDAIRLDMARTSKAGRMDSFLKANQINPSRHLAGLPKEN